MWFFSKAPKEVQRLPDIHYLTKRPGSYQVGDVINGMTVLGTNKFDTINLCAGDSIEVTWRQDDTQTVLCKATVKAEQSMRFDETVIVQTEFNGRRALGALILEAK